MAAIDKIYIKGWNNYCIFYQWVINNNHELTDKYGRKVQLSNYLREFTHVQKWIGDIDNDPEEITRPVMSNPCYVDAYLIRNCPFDFVQEELMIRYGYWSQRRLEEFYNNIKNWDVAEQGPCPYWAKLEDFQCKEDGTLILKGLEKSDYELIKEGKLYNKPARECDYVTGKHCKLVKSPYCKGVGIPFNTPIKGEWFVQVELPDNIEYGMRYHTYPDRKIGTWDFFEDYVTGAKYSSSFAYVKTIKSLIRYIRKWNLPVGTRVIAEGRYEDENYEFIVKK